MRLFVAILLSEPVKDMLMQTIRQLQPAVLDGRFSRRENLHLTLAFLGESSLKPAQQALHQLSAPSFAMTVGGGRPLPAGRRGYPVGRCAQKSRPLRAGPAGAAGLFPKGILAGEKAICRPPHPGPAGAAARGV